MEAVAIRAEEPRDVEAIRRVNLEAFGGKEEADLVDALRRSKAFVPELSLVASMEPDLVGHILFTRIAVKEPESGLHHPCLALAPMAVLPAFQNRGVGSALVARGLARATELGHAFVIVVGHRAYYPRFGFVPAGPHGISAPFPVPPEAFMVLELQPGALEGARGEVEYPPEFAGI